MSTKFSQFASGGVAEQGDIIVGLKSGNNAKFTLPAFGGVTWQTVTGSQTLISANGYVTNSASIIRLGMPLVISIGDIFEVANINSGGWQINLNAGQYIRVGNRQTTSGGSVASTDIGDSVRLVAYDANNLIILSGVTDDFVVL